ncbi:MAG: hypothetical protein H7836_12170 [Magnetococcus sp. YQC-3]
MSEEYFLPGLPVDLIRACYDAAPGDEIRSGKFASPESSSALVANTFGYFLNRPSTLPILPKCQNMGWPAVSIALEKEVRFPWSGGRHPYLDVVIKTETSFVGVESKRYEPFRSHPKPQFADAYWRPVWGNKMRMYEKIRDSLKSGSLQFNHLDAAQLVKHAFALRSSAHWKDPVLYYLFTESLVWPDGRHIPPEALHAHRDEIASFANMVAGDEVVFLWCSYRDLLTSWMESADESIRLHAKAVADRFSISLNGS